MANSLETAGCKWNVFAIIFCRVATNELLSHIVFFAACLVSIGAVSYF